MLQVYGKLPFAEIYLPTPSVFFIIIYYISILVFRFIYNIYCETNLNQTQIRVKNLIALFKYLFNKRKVFYLKIIIIFLLLLLSVNLIPGKLKIHFVDVGQGDCSFIITPNNKTILLDGGGSLSKYDVGKNTLIPYILDRGYTKIDFVIISHFDQDHVGGIFSVLQELKVGEVIIPRQIEDSENYQKFIKVVNERKIKVRQVKLADRISIEKNLYIDVLWPDENQIVENPLNNNSIVCKLNYYDFSVLFTGDIEKIAEEKIFKKVKNTALKSDVLKVAHHGSKTSTTEKFLEAVSPEIALIGVGEDNKFGHPNDVIIERLMNCGAKIYRTDEEGEITIVIDRKGYFKVRKLIYNIER